MMHGSAQEKQGRFLAPGTRGQVNSRQPLLKDFRPWEATIAHLPIQLGLLVGRRAAQDASSSAESPSRARPFPNAYRSAEKMPEKR